MNRAGGNSYKNTKERQWLAAHDQEISRKLEERCPKCNAELSAGSEPVTVGGVYGDYRIQWGKVGGLHTPRRVRIICHQCGQETPLDPGWD